MGSSYYQTRVPASSPWERDPRVLVRAQVADQSLLFGADATSAAAFWTALDNIGDYQTSSPASGTTRTVVSVSGSGSLLGLIGPTSNTAGAVTTWTVTIDGTPYTIAHGGCTGGNHQRSVIGAIFDHNDRYTTAQRSGGYNLSTDLAARSTNDNAAVLLSGGVYAAQMLQPHHIRRFIKFDTSLVVTVALSSVLSGNALAAYAGAIWHLDT